MFRSIECIGQTDNRVALVIGNANYDIGALKNPVNDAELMKQTLEELNFDVFYGTDLASKTEMLDLIREFGNVRSNYDVAFVYYAGHGIQIGNQNFLLPTEETYQSEFDVQDYGVSVQNIIRYLNSVTDKVNVFVLDACRNNPIESQWGQTRSLNQSSGLAKMAPPTGSLIAFSTEAGTTAADGSGDNSIYCKSLSENMLLPNVSLDQVFRNVRSDVVRASQGAQRPIEASQLTGETFYLRIEEDFSKIDVKNIIEKADDAFMTRDFNLAIENLSLVEIYLKTDLSRNASDLVDIYFKLGKCNVALGEIIPGEFAESMIEAGTWDDIAYQDYEALIEKYQVLAATYFKSAKEAYEKAGLLEKSNKKEINNIYSESFCKYLRLSSYVDFAKRGIDEITLITLALELIEYNQLTFGRLDFRTGYANYLAGIFMKDAKPLEAYKYFLESSTIFSEVTEDAELISDYGMSFDVNYPNKWSVLALNGVMDRSFGEDGYFNEDKGKEVRREILKTLKVNKTELFDEVIAIINDAIERQDLSSDVLGLMSAASSFTHTFPILFEVDAQTLLRCNNLTVGFSEQRLQFDADANILDSLQVGLDNAINFKNCALALEGLQLDDREDVISSLLERMTKSLRGVEQLSISFLSENSEFTYIEIEKKLFRSLSIYLRSILFYKNNSDALEILSGYNAEEVLEKAAPYYKQTLRSLIRDGNPEILDDYFSYIGLLMEEGIIDSENNLLIEQWNHYDYIWN